MALHNTLTGADLHENKGVASASNNTVATASGGATVWQLVTASNLDGSSIKNTNMLTVSGLVPDMSTNGSYVHMPLPLNCTVTNIAVSVQAAPTGSAVIDFYNGATLMTTLTISNPVAGQSYAVTLSSNNNFTGPSHVTVYSNGGTTGTCPLAATAIYVLT